MGSLRFLVLMKILSISVYQVSAVANDCKLLGDYFGYSSTKICAGGTSLGRSVLVDMYDTNDVDLSECSCKALVNSPSGVTSMSISSFKDLGPYAGCNSYVEVERATGDKVTGQCSYVTGNMIVSNGDVITIKLVRQSQSDSRYCMSFTLENFLSTINITCSDELTTTTTPQPTTPQPTTPQPTTPQPTTPQPTTLQPTTPQPTTSQPTMSTDGNINTHEDNLNIIIPVVVGVFFLIVLLLVIAMQCKRKKNTSWTSKSYSNPEYSHFEKQGKKYPGQNQKDEDMKEIIFHDEPLSIDPPSEQTYASSDKTFTNIDPVSNTCDNPLFDDTIGSEISMSENSSSNVQGDQNATGSNTGTDTSGSEIPVYAVVNKQRENRMTFIRIGLD